MRKREPKGGALAQFHITMPRPPETALAGLDSRTIAKVWVRAANKVLAKARTAASKEIRSEYMLKAADLKKSLWKMKASRQYPVARLVAHGTRIPAYHFKAKQAAKGVAIKITRKGGRQLLRHHFIQTMDSGHTGVFHRTKKFMRKKPTRQAISETRTIGVPGMLVAGKVYRRIRAVVAADAARIFANQLEFELLRRSGRL